MYIYTSQSNDTRDFLAPAKTRDKQRKKSKMNKKKQTDEKKKHTHTTNRQNKNVIEPNIDNKTGRVELGRSDIGDSYKFYAFFWVNGKCIRN